MKKIILSIFVLLGIIIIGCSDDNGINPIDLELQKNIIGTWQDNAKYTITFFQNGTFIDSMYYFDQFTDTSIIIRNGKYNISNSILTYTEFQYDTIITQSNIGFAVIERSYEISIQNSILIRKPFSVLDNIGNKRNEIWDKWQTSSWFAQIDAYNNQETYFGSYIIKYEFKQDSNKCIQTNIFHNSINDSIYEYSYYRNFNYTQPYLDISGDQDILVKFINNKMYWYYNYMPKDLIKIR